MPVHECVNDDDFRRAMSVAGAKPVIVDFTASWCGPCKMIAPKFESLSVIYGSTMTFLKVDVDKCEDSAASNGVSAMPTFIVFVNGQKMDTMRGGNPDGLEAMCVKWSKASGGGKSEIPGQMELGGLMELKQVECLNGCDDTPIRPFLEGAGVLRSDCDEQMIITIPFMQPVKLHSLGVKGSGSLAPKNVRVFANLPKTLDFDDALGIEPIQILEYGKDAQSESGEIQPLKYVKFQNVRNVTLFFENNQGNGEVTEVQDLKFYGTPVNAMNMADFKRVAGKAGEAGH